LAPDKVTVSQCESFGFHYDSVLALALALAMTLTLTLESGVKSRLWQRDQNLENKNKLKTKFAV